MWPTQSITGNSHSLSVLPGSCVLPVLTTFHTKNDQLHQNTQQITHTRGHSTKLAELKESFTSISVKARSNKRLITDMAELNLSEPGQSEDKA